MKNKQHNPQSISKPALRVCISKPALRVCNLFDHVIFDCLAHVLTIPEAHGTINGADGREFRYHSGYVSLKFSLGFSACVQNTQLD